MHAPPISPTHPSMADLRRDADNDTWTERVRVSVAGSRPVADPDPFVAKANHHIVWESDVPFAIAFEHPKPIEGTPALTSEEVPDGPGHYVASKVSREAASGRGYEYTLTVLHDNQLLTADPGGEVDPDPDSQKTGPGG